ncbi:MAG: ATP phosphoribosyltransferase [Patescibacteria group bacterium]
MRVALQAGAMKPAMVELFRDAYLPISQNSEHSFDGIAGPHTVRFMKSATIPEEVVAGEYDCGITGEDVIECSGLADNVETVVQLYLSRKSDQPIRVVLVGQEHSVFPVDGATVYVDIEYKTFAQRLKQKYPNIIVKVMLGTSEEKVRSDREFAIVATETGSSLKANGLREKQVIARSSMVLFVQKGLAGVERNEVEELGWLLSGVVNARGKVLIKMNILDNQKLSGILPILPALGSPTVMPLAGGGHAIETVIPAEQVSTLVPALKRAGASGIISQDLHLVVL